MVGGNILLVWKSAISIYYSSQYVTPSSCTSKLQLFIPIVLPGARYSNANLSTIKFPCSIKIMPTGMHQIFKLPGNFQQKLIILLSQMFSTKGTKSSCPTSNDYNFQGKIASKSLKVNTLKGQGIINIYNIANNGNE